jgi:lipoprotein NlpD
MSHRQARGQALPGLVLVALLLAGCSTSTRKAPVEERSTAPKPAAVVSAPASSPAVAAPVAAPVAAAASAPLPGAENAGKPGYHTVKAGDTLIRIALDYGQNWRDIARWNAMDNPNVVEVGQVLRIVPPASEQKVAAARPVPGGSAPTAAASSAASAAATAPASPTATASRPEPIKAPAVVVPAVPSATGGAPPPAAASDSDEIAWMWPATGAVIAGFDEGRNKGLTIAGKAGDPVIAAADGRVVYAGSSLRGYGNLVIVKHSEVFLTAYAHNQVLLVKDDQVVRRGQKIAEMGSTDAERVQLHFEIRRQGKPVDPAKLLPPR